MRRWDGGMQGRREEDGRRLVSVLMATRDRCELMLAAAASALGQEGVDLELVIVDDGSRDGTGAALAELGRRDGRVRAVSHPLGVGMAAALNTAYGMCSGELITRLDDDDLLAPGALGRMVGGCDGVPSAGMGGLDVVYTDWAVEWWDDIFGGQAGQRVERRAVEPVERMLEAGGLWGWMCRRAVVEQAGGFDPEYGPAADYEFWLRVLAAGWRFGVVHEVCYVYRYHRGGQTWRERGEQVRQAERARGRVTEVGRGRTGRTWWTEVGYGSG